MMAKEKAAAPAKAGGKNKKSGKKSGAGRVLFVLMIFVDTRNVASYCCVVDG